MQNINLLIALLVTISIFGIMMGVRARNARRAMVLATALLDGNSMSTPALRDLELSLPWSERVLKPLVQRLTGFGRIFTPERNIEQLQRDLIYAGLSARFQVADFLGLRFLSAAGLAMLFFMVARINRPASSVILFALAGFMVGLYAPNIWLRARVRDRQKGILRALPDALDMMSICVDAGLGFEAAIQKVAYYWENDLAYEFRRVIHEIRLGVTRADALRHLCDRTGVADVTNFVAVLVQADTLGISIRKVLRTQAEQMRIHRRQRAEEAAHKAPLKMLFPLTFFIFPAMFAVIMGPALPRLMEAFK